MWLILEKIVPTENFDVFQNDNMFTENDNE